MFESTPINTITTAPIASGEALKAPTALAAQFRTLDRSVPKPPLSVPPIDVRAGKADSSGTQAKLLSAFKN